jgi:hypothetical protein
MKAVKVARCNPLHLNWADDAKLQEIRQQSSTAKDTRLASRRAADMLLAA